MIRSKKTVSPENALSRLEELCARREQCTGEAYKKLYSWGLDANDAECIVRSLVDRRFIDDRRFCEAFVRDKLRFARWGRRKIMLALTQKRVDRSIVSETLGMIDEDEYIGILKKIVLAKAGTISNADSYDGRTRLFRFALSRGFEPDIVARVIRSMATD